jgi:ABC-type phosphate transport system substrate-binding protein
MLSQLLLAAAIVLSAAEAPQPRTGVPFRVITHSSNTVVSLTRAELSAIFMRRTRSWRDGAEARPVEPSTERLREQFSRAIHGKSIAYVTRYWQRVIFSGRGVPPEALPSDAAVIEFVKTHRGAIGYINGATPPGDGVKLLAVTP